MTPSLTRWLLVPFVGLAVAAAQAANLPDFTDLVDRYGGAVVNVEATGSVDTSMQDDDQQVPEIFRRFFGPGGPGGAMPRAQGPRRSLGSGFIISADGYVLTNNHVVEGADEVRVRLSDRRDLEAKIVGTDPQTDIALLKVEASALPSVTLGDSSKLRPGQWVVAIGSPFGLDHSVTAGIVSAIGRNTGGGQQYVPFIQTDVPINRGNSGGPLFNLDGQVVGINSQIFSNTGGYMGVSFAIPIDLAMNTVDQLKTSGRVSRGMIGVQIQNVDRETAKALGLPRSGGALVNNVTAGGAADKAGVKLQDVILGFNGQEVVSSADLPPLVGMTKPGSKAELSIFRDGKTINVPITVGEQPAELTAGTGGAAAAGSASNPLGLTVENLTPEQRRQLDLQDEGVVITRIGGSARASQLAPGDIVLRVGRTPIKTAADFNAAVKSVAPGDSVMLLVRRGDVTQFVAIGVPKARDDG
ncbi:MAG: DegQ family serine endoprotease [Dokdonella sp.]|nr:DegQ family serine endoprotease [Dokdonella sp.]